MESIPYFKAIEAKYIPATNTKPSTRVRLYDGRDKLFIEFDYRRNNIGQMAIDKLKAKGFNIIGEAAGINADTVIILTDTFKPIV